MANRIKVLIILNHLILLYGLIFQMSYVAVVYLVVGYLLFIKLGIECGFHRLFCHRSYTVTAKWERILLILGTLAGFGPSIAWVGIHRLHHDFADTELDPHGNISATRVWLTLWRPVIVPPHLVRHLIRSGWHTFTYKRYFWLVGFFYLIAAAIDIRFFIFGMAGACVLGFHAAGLVNTVGHRFGEKRFLVSNQSRNNKWINFLVGGNGLHNNHHAYPAAWDYRLSPGDIDIQAILIKWIIGAEFQKKSSDLPN